MNCLSIYVTSCVSFEHVDEKAMRHALKDWLQVTLQPTTVITSSSSSSRNKGQIVVLNEQNKRLALLGLNMAKSCVHSPETVLYRLAVGRR